MRVNQVVGRERNVLYMSVTSDIEITGKVRMQLYIHLSA